MSSVGTHHGCGRSSCACGSCCPPRSGSLVRVDSSGRGSRSWEFWRDVDGVLGVTTGNQESWFIDTGGDFSRKITQYEVLFRGNLEWFYSDEIFVVSDTLSEAEGT